MTELTSLLSPTSQSFHSHPHQVAGHASIFLLSPTILAKPAPPQEIEFYTTAPASLHPYLSLYYGTIPYPTLPVLGVPHPPRHTQCILLENLTHPFEKPAILDLKLGKQLHEPDASEEKTKVMIRARKETTSGTLAMRITGMKTWNEIRGEYEEYDKTFGRALTEHDFIKGVKVYLKDRREAIPLFVEQLQNLVTTLQGLSISLYSASVLLIYEADKERTMTVRVALIDFAHSYFDDEKDPAEVCTGLRNFIQYLKHYQDTTLNDGECL